MALESIERKWPRLKSDAGYRKTSPETEEYNCFAWAAGFNDRRLDPTEEPNSTWPDHIEASYDLRCFEELFAWLGFEPCDSPEIEAGYFKIVLYEDRFSGEAAHAARQLPDGKWTSKMGSWEDISHASLDSLISEQFNHTWKPAKFMKKRNEQ